MRSSKKNLLLLAVAVAGAFAALFGLVMFNIHLLNSFTLSLHMILVIVTQWSLFLVPGVLMLVNKESFKIFGFTGKRLLKQILIGIGIAAAMSAVLTVLPILLEARYMVGSTDYTQAWQFAFEFAYTILGVALAEELLFRGYIFHKLLDIKNNKTFAIIISSALFGLFHVFTGAPLQILMTALIGAFYCLCREKIKDCTILSLIVAHGVYDALIVLWVGIL